MLEQQIPVWVALLLVVFAVVGPAEWHDLALRAVQRKLGVEDAPTSRRTPGEARGESGDATGESGENAVQRVE